MRQLDQQATDIEQMESVPADIRLEFFRHDDKAKPVEGQSDTTVRLTEKGRLHATEVGEGKNPNPETAMAFGSARERAIETALRQMLAKQGVTADMTLEDIRALVSNEMEYGSKDRVSKNLNFNWNGNPEFTKIAMARYTETKDALKFLLEDSDALVQKLGDKDSTTYLRQAGNIAELVKKYLDILPTWQKIAEANPDKYPAGNREMQRFLGSHQTVTESFLMKVIEKTEGRDAVLKFIDEQKDKNGFGFSEGYTIKVETLPDVGNVAVLAFKDKHWTLKAEDLQQIIDERDKFNKSINS